MRKTGETGARSGRRGRGQPAHEPDKTAPALSQRDAWDLAYERRGSQWNGRIPKLPELPPASLALDLGCGDGRVLCAMLERGWRAIGVDFSRKGVVKATKRPAVAEAVRSGKAELVLTDATTLPFADGVFEVVAAVHVLAHLDEEGRKAALKEAARVLRHGGYLVFADFSIGDFRSGIGEGTEAGTRVRNGIATHYFGIDEVAGLLSDFTLEEMSPVGWTVRIGGKACQREEIVAIVRRA